MKNQTTRLPLITAMVMAHDEIVFAQLDLRDRHGGDGQRDQRQRTPDA